MTIPLQTHYLHGNAEKTPCGLLNPSSWTTDPGSVTCLKCSERVNGPDDTNASGFPDMTPAAPQTHKPSSIDWESLDERRRVNLNEEINKTMVASPKTNTGIGYAANHEGKFEVPSCEKCGVSGCVIHDQVTPALKRINEAAGKQIYADPSFVGGVAGGNVKPTGTKRDRDKTRYDLIPHPFLESLAKILTFGAQTYGPNNWRMMEDLGRFEAAFWRHWIAYKNGEFFDPETGQPHLYHATCNLMFICEILRPKAEEKRG